MSRALSALLVLVVLSVATFALQPLLPGDPARQVAGEGSDAARVETVREQMGLNEPIAQQYVDWVTSAVHGDLGESWSVRAGKPVSSLLRERLGVTLSLALFAIVLAITIAVTLGTVAAVFQGRWIDRAITVVSSLGMAMPSFWFGLLLVYVFSLRLGWLPAIGYRSLADDPRGWFTHMVLPALALSVESGAQLTRQLRTSLVEVLRSEFVRTARAKGIKPLRILTKHGLKNAAIPVVTLLGLQLVNLLGGALIIEVLFALPGLGMLVSTAVLNRDMPIIQGVALVFGVAALVINQLVEVTYRHLDPRLRGRRHGGRRR